MSNGRNILFVGAFYGLFVAAAVYWLGVYLEVTASDTVRILFAVGVGALASMVFFLSYLAGKRRDRGDK